MSTNKLIKNNNKWRFLKNDPVKKHIDITIDIIQIIKTDNSRITQFDSKKNRKSNQKRYKVCLFCCMYLDACSYHQVEKIYHIYYTAPFLLLQKVVFQLGCWLGWKVILSSSYLGLVVLCSVQWQMKSRLLILCLMNELDKKQ